MHRLTCPLLIAVTLGLLPGTPVSAQDRAVPVPTAEERQVVDALFRDKITAVRRSRDQEDDATLIAEMMQTAAQIPDSPGAQWLIYTTAIELGMSTDAFASAIEAAMERRALFPGTAETTDESLLALMQEAYRGSRREERDAIADPYMALLLEMGRSAESSEETVRAAVFYREGATVARAVRSPMEETFADHVARLSAIEALGNRIRTLANALETNPRNVSAAEELTMLLVLERRDLVAAAEYVELTRDPDLIDVIKMGTAGADEIDAPGALRVGDWFYRLSETNEEHTTYLLTQAIAYYERFLSVYGREDGLRSRVAQIRGDAVDRLDAINQSAEEALRGTWRDGLALVNPRVHTIGEGSILARNGRLFCDHAGFVVPVVPGPAYDLRFTVELDEGEDGIVVYLPVGERGAVFQFSRWNHTRTQIDGVGRTDEPQFMLTPGREAQVQVAVVVLGEGRARIAVEIDGESCLQWEGAQRDLANNWGRERRQLVEQHGNAVAFLCAGRYIFNAIELRQPDN